MVSAPGEESDSSKKAAIFVKATRAKIGSEDTPKLDVDTLTFVSENMVTEPAFKALVGINTPHVKTLRMRRQAFLTIRAYVDVCEDVNNENPSCKADGAGVNRCVKKFVFDCFREIFVLAQMYEHCRNGGEPINPNGWFRAAGTSAEQIHLSTGGLASFLQYGEPTLVSYIVMALEARESTLPPPMQLLVAGSIQGHQMAPQTLGQVEVHPKRQREAEGMRQQTVPPYEWVCSFCGKPRHSAMVCRDRLREEKKQKAQLHQLQSPVRAPPAQLTTSGVPPTADEAEAYARFQRFESWMKLNKM